MPDINKYKLPPELTPEQQAELNNKIKDDVETQMLESGVELKTKGYYDKLGRYHSIMYVEEDGYLRGVKAADERAELDKQKELNGETIIEITEKEYAQLLKDSETLHRLEVYGVDNWVGYGDAINDSEGWAK